jgi:hypothetical protein
MNKNLQFTHKPNLAEHIRTCDARPSKAFSEARRYQAEVRPDWKYTNIGAVCVASSFWTLAAVIPTTNQMEVALWYKFNQHLDLKDDLLNTGTAELVEVCILH